MATVITGVLIKRANFFCVLNFSRGYFPSIDFIIKTLIIPTGFDAVSLFSKEISKKYNSEI